LTPFEALSHPFFDELRKEEVYGRLKKDYGLGDLFDFHAWGECKGRSWERLVPGWYRG